MPYYVFSFRAICGSRYMSSLGGGINYLNTAACKKGQVACLRCGLWECNLSVYCSLKWYSCNRLPGESTSDSDNM